MRTVLILLTFAATTFSYAQNNVTFPDSIDLVEAGDEIKILDGAFIFGKSHTVLYFAGKTISQLAIQVGDGEEVSMHPERDRKEIDYLKFRTWDITFQGRSYKAEVALIQVDWPGNEINWRMIPRIHFTEVTE